MTTVKVGFQLVPQFGDMSVMRSRWMEAESLGVDSLWTCDHFKPQKLDPESLKYERDTFTADGKNFEATTVQAAMAATTTRPEIGCMVHGNSYRNPNLMADIARTIDHISGGRFILGLGAGYLKDDYDEYGYDFGTAKSRMLDLIRDVPIIKARYDKLNPPPVRKIPLLIAGTGPLGLKLVAQHADMWNVAGPYERVREKIQALKLACAEVGRPFEEIELTAMYTPQLLGEDNDDDLPRLYELGIRHFVVLAQGPDWDLGRLRRVLAWRNSLS